MGHPGEDEYWKAYDKENANGMNALYQILGVRVDDLYSEFASGNDEVRDALIKSSFATGTWRYEHIKLADAFSKAGGTYMYYWNVPSTKDEYYKLPCHAIEFAYVFNNLEDDIYAGEVDADAAARAQEAWVNFAKNGAPSIEGVTWEKYRADDRNTMEIDKDGVKAIKDPLPEVTKLLIDMDASFDMF